MRVIRKNIDLDEEVINEIRIEAAKKGYNHVKLYIQDILIKMHPVKSTNNV